MKRSYIRVIASVLLSATLLLPTAGSVVAHDTTYCGHANMWQYGTPSGYNTEIIYSHHYTTEWGDAP